jgi:hypothetical protein
MIVLVQCLTERGQVDNQHYVMDNCMKNKHAPFIILITICLIAGLATVADYGESQDEYLHIQYSENTLANYLSLFSKDTDLVLGPENLRFYGPFSDFIIQIGIQVVGLFTPNYSIITTRHLIYFLFYLVSIISLHSILIKLISPKAAYVTLLLYVTQPILWGHAFINPKDIPFMSAFLISIAIGIQAADKISPLIDTYKSISFNGLRSAIKREWGELQNKTTIILLCSIYTLAIFLAWLFHDQIFALIESSLFYLDSNRGTFWGNLFSNFAEHSTSIPISSYLSKSIILAKRIYYLLIIAGFLIFLIKMALLLPEMRKGLWNQAISPLLKNLLNTLKNPWVIITGLSIGATTAIRILGPYAGFLISIYFLFLFKRRGLIPIISLGMISVLAVFFLWPYLWGAPIDHFLKSFSMMSRFPWYGSIMFNGLTYPSVSLPKSYLPVLLSIQLTEPIPILFVFGLILAVKDVFFQESKWKIWILVLLWFFVVFFYVVGFNPILYDNFRQLLFIVPPIFILSGQAVAALLELIKPKLLYWVVAVLLIIPGICSIIFLHPYEYIYYNSYVGGVNGAFRQYENDYMITSFYEAAEYINSHAEKNARVLVWGNSLIVSRIARDDLIIESDHGGTYDLETGYDYVILSTRWNFDLRKYPEAPIIFCVERGRSVLVVVKQLCRANSYPCP